MSEAGGELSGVGKLYIKVREKISPEFFPRIEEDAGAEVFFLEKALGIKFTKIPEKVQSSTEDYLREAGNLIKIVSPEDGGNRLKRFFQKGKNEAYEIIASEFLRSASGFFSPVSEKIYHKGEYAYFWHDREGVMPELKKVNIVSLHEAMHAFHFQRDSTNKQVGFEGLQALTSLIFKIGKREIGKEEARDLFEEMMVNRTMGEGIAEFGSRITHSYILEEWGKRFVEMGRSIAETTEFLDRLNKDVNKPIDISADNIKTQTEKIKNYIKTQTEILFFRFSPANNQKLAKSLIEVNDAFYPVGFNFVNSCVRAMGERGISMSDALGYIIDHPPKKIDEISDPLKYLEKEGFKK